MNYYTATIPLPLAEKLKEKGMPIEYHPLFTPECEGADQSVGLIRPMYCEVFDWLMEKKGWIISISREFDFAAERVTERFEWGLARVGCFSSLPDDGGGFCDTWHEAANEAIEKALTLI